MIESIPALPAAPFGVVGFIEMHSVGMLVAVVLGVAVAWVLADRL